MLLLCHGHPTIERYASPHLGRLIQPRHTSSIERTAAAGIPWAADNDCFQGLDIDPFCKMLDRIKELPGCLFVTCPDVVGDHDATMAMFHRWAPGLARRGLPIAFVLQNGCTPETVPWRDISAVFIGGDDAFKMGRDAELITREAKLRGKHVHMGRVNTWRRIQYAASIGVDTVDGTKWSRWIDRWLAEGINHVSQPAQGRLEETVCETFLEAAHLAVSG